MMTGSSDMQKFRDMMQSVFAKQQNIGALDAGALQERDTRIKQELIKRYGLADLNPKVWGWSNSAHKQDECPSKVKHTNQSEGENIKGDDNKSEKAGENRPHSPSSAGNGTYPSTISCNSASVTDMTSDLSDSDEETWTKKETTKQHIRLLFMTITGGKVEAKARTKTAMNEVFKIYAIHTKRKLQDLRFFINGNLHDTNSRLPVSSLRKTGGGKHILVQVIRVQQTNLSKSTKKKICRS